MDGRPLAKRLRRLPRAVVLEREVAVASTRRARLLGLAGLAPDRATGGLLIPRCRCVHTFGMRFALDLMFLDEADDLIETRGGVPPRRLAWCRRASSVLELPAQG